MVRFFLQCVIAILFVVSLAFSTVQGQSNQSGQNTDTDAGSDNITSLSGEIGIIGELYSIDGRDNRRPSSTARLFFRPTLTILNSIELDFNFILTTEGSSSRQDINQFDFNPKWSWGEIHAGDFTHNYTPLTLSGIKIRGGGVILHPGNLRFSLLTGITKRSVSSQEYRSYKRVITAGSIGVGRQDGSSVDLTVLTARDGVSSLEDAAGSMVVDTIVDASMPDTIMDPNAVTPQENLVVSLRSHLVFFDRKVSFSGEISGCGITRDRRSSEIDMDDIPELVESIFVPRISSSADYAFHTKVAAHLLKMTLDLGYEYIGPGYVSLGLSSLHNDRKSISTSMAYRCNRYTIKFNTTLSRDNLINQKSCTTNRNRFGISANLRPVRPWNCLLAVNLTTMKNDAGGSLLIDYRNWIIRTSQILALRHSLVKNAAVDYTLQKSDEANPARQNAEIASHSIGVRSLINAARGFDITPSVRLNFLKPASGNQRTTTTYALNTRVLLLQNKLQNSGMISLTRTDYANTLQFNVKSTYLFAGNTRLSGEILTNSYRTDRTDAEFDEFTFRVNLVRSF